MDDDHQEERRIQIDVYAEGDQGGYVGVGPAEAREHLPGGQYEKSDRRGLLYEHGDGEGAPPVPEVPEYHHPGVTRHQRQGDVDRQERGEHVAEVSVHQGRQGWVHPQPREYVARRERGDGEGREEPGDDPVQLYRGRASMHGGGGPLRLWVAVQPGRVDDQHEGDAYEREVVGEGEQDGRARRQGEESGHVHPPLVEGDDRG